MPKKTRMHLAGTAILGFLALGFAFGQTTRKAGSPDLLPNYLLFSLSFPSFDETAAELTRFLTETYNISGDIDLLEFKHPDYAYRLLDGVHLSPIWGMEAEFLYYDRYHLNALTSTGEVLRVKREALGFSLKGTGRYKVKNWFTLYGGVGAAYWRMDSKLSTASSTEDLVPTKTHDDGVDLLLSAALRKTIKDRLLLSLGWETTAVDDADLSTVTVSVGFKY